MAKKYFKTKHNGSKVVWAALVPAALNVFTEAVDLNTQLIHFVWCV